jgi:hypothetical protein
MSFATVKKSSGWVIAKSGRKAFVLVPDAPLNCMSGE